MRVAGIEDIPDQAGQDACAPEHDSIGKELIQASDGPASGPGEAETVESQRGLNCVRRLSRFFLGGGLVCVARSMALGCLPTSGSLSLGRL